uniref:Uncharacterized protein n=1 Tax=Zonotrichia albicollis TaxID=44394 RepID=A0A8D2MVX5_ZONAL
MREDGSPCGGLSERGQGGPGQRFKMRRDGDPRGVPGVRGWGGNGLVLGKGFPLVSRVGDSAALLRVVLGIPPGVPCWVWVVAAGDRQQLCVPPTGSSAMFYLAAAVSDFYIPVSEMPEHKIQSSEGPLQVSAALPDMEQLQHVCTCGVAHEESPLRCLLPLRLCPLKLPLLPWR